MLRDHEVLLVRRGKEPGRGLWSLPGGRLQWGESLAQGVEREVREETCLEVRAVAMAGVTEVRFPAQSESPDFHFVLIDYFCEVVSGTPRCADDADEVCWHDVRRLDELQTTEGLAEKLQKWLQDSGR